MSIPEVVITLTSQKVKYRRWKLFFSPLSLTIGVYYNIVNRSLHISIPFISLRLLFRDPLKLRHDYKIDAKQKLDMCYSREVYDEIESYSGDYFKDQAFHEDCGDR